MKQLTSNDLLYFVSKTQLDFQRFENSDFGIRKDIFYYYVTQMQTALNDSDASIICFTLFRMFFKSFIEVDVLRNDILLNNACPEMYQKTFYKINTIYQQLKFNLN